MFVLGDSREIMVSSGSIRKTISMHHSPSSLLCCRSHVLYGSSLYHHSLSQNHSSTGAGVWLKLWKRTEVLGEGNCSVIIHHSQRASRSENRDIQCFQIFMSPSSAAGLLLRGSRIYVPDSIAPLAFSNCCMILSTSSML